MKLSIVAASLLSCLALANPILERRKYVTSWDIETVTVTVTGGGNGKLGSWGNWAQVPSTDVSVAPEAASRPSSVADGFSLPQMSASPTTSASSTANTAGLSDYAAPILKQHNLHRANHSAPDLEWDDELATIAATIAATCIYDHNRDIGGGGYGQNIGAGAASDHIDAMNTNQMYNDEIGYYPGYGSEPDMSQLENWGHFSQIVWKDTTKLGCATQYCSGGLTNTGSGVSPYFTVCNYKPSGNFGGQYAANVLAPLGDAVVSIASG